MSNYVSLYAFIYIFTVEHVFPHNVHALMFHKLSDTSRYFILHDELDIIYVFNVPPTTMNTDKGGKLVGR